ncbi:hypothetical protein PVAP13_7KG239800 [Panicum virgatum]|uniref:Uncharacterized protein n=1 Tax=Panicum virgatum TaxID=38727 RepID=A0A8T0QJI2_PANVG|nr:hypothetical protein PVAP13_7KG239800 [Panicum virgatum]
MAVVVRAASHGAGVVVGAAAAATPASTAPLVLPACAVCCVAASAGGVPSLLAYYVTLGVSLACFAGAVWPDRVGAVLGPLGALARRGALRARADLAADLRRLRAHPATAPACVAVAGCAGGARRWAEARWGEHRDAAGAAWFALRLTGRVVRLAATALLDAACEEARAQAPSVLGYLRGAIHAIRSPASCKKGDEEEGAAVGFVLRDIVCLVGIGFYILGTQFYAACLAAACGLAMLAADWIYLPDDDDDDGEAGTTGDGAGGADGSTTQQREGDAAGEARLDVQESWLFLRVLTIVAFCFDALLLHVTLGPRPIELAFLALWNFEVLSVGRQAGLTPDDGEGAEGPAAEGVDGAVGRWRCGAMAVLAASGVKIFVIYLVLGFYLAALSFLWLCVMADLLLLEEDSFLVLEMDESGDDEDREEELAGIGEDITVGADEGADENRAQHSSTSSSEDEEEANASSSEDEEEGCAVKEHCDTSSSEEREHLEEQRREEPDGSSRVSTDEDDSWDLVEIDPEMPAKDNCGANRKPSRLLFPMELKIPTE